MEPPLRFFADMAELADALDLGSSGQPCRFKSCYPHLAARKRTGMVQVSRRFAHSKNS